MHFEDEEHLERFATRIAENLLRGGMGERHTDTAIGRKLADEFRDANYPFGRGQHRVDEFEAVPHEAGPLREIVRQIQHKTRDINEFAAKLNEHADLVHGHVADEELSIGAGVRPAEPPHMPALGAIFCALSEMDNALSRLAVASGRNTTLA